METSRQFSTVRYVSNLENLGGFYRYDVLVWKIPKIKPKYFICMACYAFLFNIHTTHVSRHRTPELQKHLSLSLHIRCPTKEARCDRK